MPVPDPQDDFGSLVAPGEFRQVLGQYPTGVCVVTATQADGFPVGLVVGSFTSVSLEPPLVAFFPGRQSGAWARIRQSPNFCVNILSAHQEAVCRRLASRDPDKFRGIGYTLSPGGAPIIHDVVAWIDCKLHHVDEAGDHHFVVGLVQQLEIARGGLPLLFFQGGYGGFAPLSIVMSDTHGLVADQLRIIDRARPEMESLAADLGAQCLATTRVGDDLVFAASAGQASCGPTVPGVGQRLPFIPPIGFLFAAWLPADQILCWLSRYSEPERERFRNSMNAVRKRGFSIWLLNEAQRTLEERLSASTVRETALADFRELIDQLEFDPVKITKDMYKSIRMISVPIIDRSGTVVLALSVSGFPLNAKRGVIDLTNRLMHAADRVTALLQT